MLFRSKPANVMFDKDRKDLIVMDFGLARGPVMGPARDTQSGVVMGTPAYMSPEQARGDSKGVGPAGDIFSLGVIMYELLTGKRPFLGTATEVISQIMLTEPQPPRAVRAGIDQRLEAVCLKAMAKDPEKRFASMGAFASALDECLRPAARPDAETARPSVTRPDADDGLNTDRRKLADLFGAVAEERKAARADTAKAVDEAIAKHRSPRWLLYVAVGLSALALAGAAAAIVFFVQNDKVKVTLTLKDIDLSDKALSFTLDGKAITAEELAKEVELKPGEHELVVYRGKNVERRLRFKVTGGRSPTIEYQELTGSDSPAPSQPPPATTPAAESEFKSIFNGKDLSGWKAATRPEAFGVDPDGNLTAKGDTPAGRAHWLLTEKEYTDYVLRMEVMFMEKAGCNSGIAIRSQADGAAVSPQRLNVELRNFDRGKPRVGALVYTVSDAVEPKDPIGVLGTGEWHKFEIEVRGQQVKVTINDKLVTDADMTKIDRTLLNPKEKWAEANIDRKSGHIGIQSHRNPVKFRNIRVKELTGAPVGPLVSDGWKGLELVKTLPHKYSVSDARFSADGAQLLTATPGGNEGGKPVGGGVVAGDVKSWKPIGAPVETANAGRFTFVGGKLVIAIHGAAGSFGRHPAQFVVWNPAKRVQELKFPFEAAGAVLSLDAMPDGKSYLTSVQEGDEPKVAVLDLATGETRFKMRSNCGCVANDKEGKTILVCDGADLKQIDVATEKVLRTLKGHTEFVWYVACSPDGRFAASSSFGKANELILWDLTAPDGAPVVLGKSKARLNCLAFSPNGKSLLSGSTEGILKLWDVVERKEVTSARADPGSIPTVRFSPDGTLAVTTGEAAKVWKLTK